MAVKWQEADQTRWAFFCIIIRPASVLDTWDSQPGTGVGGREQWTEKHIIAILGNWPTSKKTRVHSKWHYLIWFWDFASYKYAGLPRTGKGRRKIKGNEHFHTIYRLLPFSPTPATKNLPSLEEWRWRRVRGGALMVTGFLPRGGNHTLGAVKNESFLFYQDFADLLGNLSLRIQ